jgi:HEAT repeat protein
MDKFEEAIKALMDTNPEIRKQAVRDLGELKDIRAVDPLLPVTNDEDVGVRRSAIEALGKIGDARAIPDMGQTYLGPGPSYLTDFPFIDLRKAKEEDILFVAQAIRQIGPSADDILIDIVENQGGYDYYITANSKICWQVALLALWMSPGKRAAEVIARLLEHQYPHVRDRFIQFLGGRSENRARTFLVSALGDSNEEVRVDAAKALGFHPKTKK